VATALNDGAESSDELKAFSTNELVAGNRQPTTATTYISQRHFKLSNTKLNSLASPTDIDTAFIDANSKRGD
jgi:hypothetical protein